jgi:hypothetical protein
MTSPLENLSALGGPLHREPTDRDEYAGLIHSGRVRLGDAEVDGISPEGRFDLAYNAAHALSLAALRRAGFRSDNRYIVFQALQHTLGLEPAVWRVLAKAHEGRNRSEYSGHFRVDERLLAELVESCKKVMIALDALPPIP